VPFVHSGRFASYPSIVDKVVIVTKGGSGIGAAITEAFHEQKAKVAFLDIAETPSAELANRLGGVSYLRCDLTDIIALRNAISEVASSLGPIGILNNNAGNDDQFEAKKPGTLIHHEPWVAHAIETQNEPLLAAWIWMGGNLSYDSYSLER